jgi:hypothetical protein
MPRKLRTAERDQLRVLARRLKMLRGDRTQDDVVEAILRQHPDQVGRVHQTWMSRREAGVGLNIDEATLIAEALGYRVVLGLEPVSAEAAREADDATRSARAILDNLGVATEVELAMIQTLAEGLMARAKRHRRARK